jgi:transaldolase/glucose-6-phosphate isomerase
MADRCVTDEDENPGAALGTFMGSHAQAGRDKLTLMISPALAPLGPWIEQLVAESTGKQGRGVLPIVDEPVATANEYGRDRAFVIVTADRGDDVARIGRKLQAAGQPVFTIDTSPADLGGEFFRWEFATAIAGAVLGVNPFDEPNVRDAKTRTQRQLDQRARSGAFDINPPLTDVTPVTARREHRGTGVVPDAPYVAILDYLPSDGARTEAIARLRATIRRRTGAATTYGVGPRYLHSTGQYHKGGPNSGRFILLTGADGTMTHVPGTEYTFSVLKQAQALGDFDALVAAGREVVHYHLSDASADASAWLETIAFDLG